MTHKLKQKIATLWPGPERRVLCSPKYRVQDRMADMLTAAAHELLAGKITDCDPTRVETIRGVIRKVAEIEKLPPDLVAFKLIGGAYEKYQQLRAQVFGAIDESESKEAN